ncbi:MAG: carbamoyl-phosphate synthase large subunit [Nitrospirota bacterium]
MPKRTDIHKILLIGSGPIVIGQGCEFDYSGTQACRSLREEGYFVILVNSNPATIMTDSEMADRTYIEPITVEILEKIIERERPDAVLSTMGGQTALNMATALHEQGILKKYNVELIGAKYESIQIAEDRALFKKKMEEIGLKVPKGGAVKSLEEAIALQIPYPAIIRPSFTLGGGGASIAHTPEEFESSVLYGLAMSPIHEVLVEQSILGWKEFELEVMRDKNDNVVIVCSIENIDPIGIHTGDSITVAPAQTLTDKQYQLMRNAAIQIMRAVGVTSGGSNVQFAIHPETGEMQIIEMNPRVSRSSALASKATGFPIAKIAAKLAVGMTLDEIQNDITRATPACFEPTIDYVVVKMPRFAFEKFPTADSTLTIKMKSVGEVMAIGRNFKEALQKASRSMETGQDGISKGLLFLSKTPPIFSYLPPPTHDWFLKVSDAFRSSSSIETERFLFGGVDPWFLQQIQEIVDMERNHFGSFDDPRLGLRQAKEAGFSDRQIAGMLAKKVDFMEGKVADMRRELGIRPVYKRVDTCGAEFEAHTPYFYSTYDEECEANPTQLKPDQKKVVILGSGPNRIGQGVEFDYCCVHAAFAVREMGHEAIMVNCNPETVSTDYDISDRLYFEPLTFEDVMNIVETEKPTDMIVQFGGQTPLKLAARLSEAGVPISGTDYKNIHRAESRAEFNALIRELGLRQPEGDLTHNAAEAITIAEKIGFPVLIRPSYVLGGLGMKIVYNNEDLKQHMGSLNLLQVRLDSHHPLLIDQYLEDAVEVDVDAVCDCEKNVYIGGIMEHIEEAGIHSGDSACVLPPISLTEPILKEINDWTEKLAQELNVIGLMNVQYAIKDNRLYVLEVNPRGSRTVPFVSKATGVPLAKIAMRVILGEKLTNMKELQDRPRLKHIAVKEAVFPFLRLDVDPELGPEMKSTGEVMGIDSDFGMAYAKAQEASGNKLPLGGKVFLSVKDRDKAPLYEIAKHLLALGFRLTATRGTARYLSNRGIDVDTVNKVSEGSPHIVDSVLQREIQLVINTGGGQTSPTDTCCIRKVVLQVGVPYFTTIAGAKAAIEGIVSLKKGEMTVTSLKEYYGERKV